MGLIKKNKIRVEYAGLTDVGLQRSENQDSLGQYPENSLDSYNPGGLLFMVADGMGGHQNGKEASRMAVNIASSEYLSNPGKETGKTLNRAIQSANAEIFKKSSQSADSHQMGTTLSVLTLTDEIAHIAHVGDSRIYLIRNGKLLKLTTDHTKVEELKRAGLIDREEAKSHPEKSVLHRALGVKAQVKVDLSSDIPVKPGDIFILCTDGLAKVTKDELLHIAQNETPQQACKRFIDLANKRGGHDNSTVQVLKILTGAKIKKPTRPAKRAKASNLYLLWYGLGFLTVIFIATVMYVFLIYKNLEPPSRDLKTWVKKSVIDETNDLFKQGRSFVNQRRYEDAIQTYQQILQLNPLDLDALRELDRLAGMFIREGQNYERRGDFNSALKKYHQALEIRTNDTELKEIIKSLENR